MSVLIWVQTVCQGNQQTTKAAASKERAKHAVIRKDPALKEFICIEALWPKDAQRKTKVLYSN